MAVVGRIFRKRLLTTLPVEEERPNFGIMQIRSQKGGNLCPGKIICIRKNGGRLIVKITQGPHSVDGILMLDYEYIEDRELKTESIRLDEFSVIRNSKKTWNTKSWLERA